MTNDDDRVAYLAGDDADDLDDVARADLDDLKALLADPALWAAPGPELEDAVIAAISAEARERPAHDERVVGAAPARARASARRSRFHLRTVLTAAAAVVVLAVTGYVLANRDSGTDQPQFSLSLEPTELLPEASGTGTATRTESGWRIEIDATGLPRLEDGRYYQAWLKNADDVLVPIGTFNEGHDVVLWAGVRPVDFPTITVTEESTDGDQASSGQRVLVGTIDVD